MRLLAKLVDGLSRGLYPCVFHLATGAYCPGCGGTRSLVALFEGQIADSIRLNPLVPYMAVMSPVILLYYLYCRITGKIMAPRIWMIAVIVGGAILVSNFIVKNYFLLVRHVDLLAVIY